MNRDRRDPVGRHENQAQANGHALQAAAVLLDNLLRSRELVLIEPVEPLGVKRPDPDVDLIGGVWRCGGAWYVVWGVGCGGCGVWCVVCGVW